MCEVQSVKLVYKGGVSFALSFCSLYVALSIAPTSLSSPCLSTLSLSTLSLSLSLCTLFRTRTAPVPATIAAHVIQEESRPTVGPSRPSAPRGVGITVHATDEIDGHELFSEVAVFKDR